MGIQRVVRQSVMFTCQMLFAVVPQSNRSRAGQDAGSGFAFEAGIDGIAEPPVDGTFLEAAGF